MPAQKSQTFSIGPKEFSKEEMRRWLDVQLYYPNLASGGKEEMLQRVSGYVNTVVQQHQRSMQSQYGKWRELNNMIRGKSTSVLFPDSDLHVPEMYKMVERLVPRIVQALLGADEQWFRVVGRDEMDREVAKKITYWLRYLIDQCGIDRVSEEWIRCAIVHQFFAVKTSWCAEFEKRVKREYTKTRTSDGKWKYKVKAKEVDQLAYEGMKLELIEPMYFLFDYTKTDVKDMSFVGDQTWWSEEELLAAEDMGTFANVRDLLKRPGGSIQNTGNMQVNVESYRHERRMVDGALPAFNGTNGTNARKGEPRQFLITELWCKWRPTDRSRFEEYVLTTCGDVVLRVQKNPYDDKHRPYAVARVAREPFDFLNVGVLDHAARLNVELDEHRNLGRMNSLRSQCPIVVAPTDSDIPENLFHADPGQVFFSDSPELVREIRAQPMLSELAGLNALIVRDIEDITGAPSLFAGQDTSDTATQGVQNRLEANMRMRRLIYAIGEGFAEILRQGYALSQQFVSYPRRFAVLNEHADTVFEVAPEDFSDPVDIVLVGPSRLESYGLDGTKLATWMNVTGQMLPLLAQDGTVSIPELYSTLFEKMVGMRMGENLIRKPRPVSELMHPADEEILLSMGKDVHVHELDIHPEHIATHEMGARNETDPEKLMRRQRHLAEHKYKHNAQMAQRAAMERQAVPPFRPSGGGAEAPAVRNAPGEGNTYQAPPDLRGESRNQTPPREAPGPASDYNSGRPDREPPITQTANIR